MATFQLVFAYEPFEVLLKMIKFLALHPKQHSSETNPNAKKAAENG